MVFLRGNFASRLEHYSQEYGQGRMTLARAAEEAGVSIWEIVDHLGQRKIPAQYSLEDLEHDLKVVYQGMGRKQ